MVSMGPICPIAPIQPPPTMAAQPTPQPVVFAEQVERDVLAPIKKPGLFYLGAVAFCALVFACGMAAWANQIMKGMGMAGINNPVGWGVYITNFVFWVGIAHSGTLISAVLFLFRAKFRSRFNRAAEAMTVFAVMTAGLYPLIHLGRVWFAYWLFPYPNGRQLWVNFKSPLVWDVFAVSTYFTVSAVFFYVGLIPDLAITRNRATGIRRWICGIASLGWNGTPRQWKHYHQLYIVLAAFATPLVVSVHSVVSWDFAMSIVPGWHTTIFAPYFVAGAILSGCAMVLTLVIPMRKILKLEEYITVKHLASLAQLLLLTSLIVGYAYGVEFFMAWYSGSVYEKGHFLFRAFGEYRVGFYWMVLCNVLLPLGIFFRRLRENVAFLFVLSLFVNVGMWCERFVIIVSSLARDFNPYVWGNYKPSLTEIGITVGSFGMFFMLFLLFCKVLPVLSITEIEEEHAQAEARQAK